MILGSSLPRRRKFLRIRASNNFWQFHNFAAGKETRTLHERVFVPRGEIVDERAKKDEVKLVVRIALKLRHESCLGMDAYFLAALRFLIPQIVLVR